MKFATDDDGFGVVIAATESRRMFRFQLVVAGRVLGDREPSIIGSAMERLRSPKRLSDPRLAPDSMDPAAVMHLLETDDELHDAAMLSIAESLDNWILCSYAYEDKVVFVGHEYRLSETSGEVLSAIVESSDYHSIIEMVRTYWSRCESGTGS